MSDNNFANLTVGLHVRKGEAEPSQIMLSEVSAFARRIPPAPVDAPIPAAPTPPKKRRELSAPPAVAEVAAKPPRITLQLSATEYVALGLVAVKRGTTPQHLLREALHEFLAGFVKQYNSP